MRSELLRRAGYCLACVLLLVAHVARAQDAQLTIFSIADDNPPPGLADSGFGATVAVSGETIFIGVPYYVDSVSFPTFHGRVGIYFNSNPTPGELPNWNRTGSIIANDQRPNETQFGNALGLSGKQAAIGSSSAVRIYQRQQGQWQQTDTIFWPADESAPKPVMVLDNGILVYRVLKNSDQSIVYSYQLDSTGKAQLLQKLKAPAGNDGDFGASLALKNGKLVVGSAGLTSATDPQPAGLVYVYELSGTSWDLKQKLTPAVASTNSNFGAAVAINHGAIVVGAPGENVVIQNGVQAQGGMVHVFLKQGGRYADVQDVAPYCDAGAGCGEFGAIMAAGGEGHVVIGAPQNLPNSNGQAYGVDGETFIYEWEADTLTLDFPWWQSPQTSMAGDGRYLIVGSDQPPMYPDNPLYGYINEATLFDFASNPNAPPQSPAVP